MAIGKIGACSALLSSALVALSAHNAMAQGAPPPDAGAPPPGSAGAPPPPGAAGAPPPAVVNTTVNLRQGPGTTYTVISKIPGGSPVDVSGCTSGWCQVAYQGQNGYIIATSLAPAGEASGGPPPGAPPPGYAGPPPPGYGDPPPGYYGPPGYVAPPPYYYGGYYGPYYYGYGGYWGGRGGWGRRW
jgi:Bacterial SH3 domain